MKSHPGFARKQPIFRLLSIALLALSCAACGMNLRSEPEGRGPGLAGQWQLLTQRDALAVPVRTAMEQAQAKQEKRYRRHLPPVASAGEPVSTDEIPPPDGYGVPVTSPGAPASRNAWWVRELREHQEALLNAVLPSNSLRIGQSARRIELIPDVGAARRFDMGVSSTLVRSFATLRIESGWQGEVFVVHSRDAEQGIDIVERYRRQGTHLHMQVQLKMPDAQEQLFVADYTLAKP